MKRIGNKIYDVCANCGSLVQINKFLFGSLHICTTEEERKEYAKQIEKQWRYKKQALDRL